MPPPMGLFSHWAIRLPLGSFKEENLSEGSEN